MKIHLIAVAAFLVAFVLPVGIAHAETLQSMIDKASAGDVVTPPAGIYKERIVIDKALTLDGQNKVTIDADGEGTVIFVETNGATVENLRIINSGDQHNDLDSGVMVRGNGNVVKDNVLENVLFGVDLGQSDNNIIKRNKISSKDFKLGVKGDAIRLWYSKNNKISENIITKARDFVVWYSEGNIIEKNKIYDGRYGLHFMYSLYNRVDGNLFYNNSVGIFLMYSDGIVVENNTVMASVGGMGMGIGYKETSDTILRNNKIYYCARGIYSDVSPYQPDTINHITSNHIAFNGVGLTFHNDWTGNEIRDNRFEDNFIQVAVDGFETAKRNDWSGNRWDDYQGFDRDKNGIGDTPYIKRTYADRIWMDVPFAGFFKGSPVLSLLDFLERLAPFTEPLVLLQDDSPKMAASAKAVVDVEIERAADKGGEETFDPFGLKN